MSLRYMAGMRSAQSLHLFAMEEGIYVYDLLNLATANLISSQLQFMWTLLFLSGSPRQVGDTVGSDSGSKWLSFLVIS